MSSAAVVIGILRVNKYCTAEKNHIKTAISEYLPVGEIKFKDGLPYLFHSFRNKYFNKISLGNMLYFQNKL